MFRFTFVLLLAFASKFALAHPAGDPHPDALHFFTEMSHVGIFLLSLASVALLHFALHRRSALLRQK